MPLPVVRYRQSEYLMPWRWRKRKSVDRFILEIPYGMYFSVVPGFLALNELLERGSAGGGMGTGVTWEPFSLTQDEYVLVVDAWQNLDLRKIPRLRGNNRIDISCILDDEILAIPKHLDYLARSAEKYSTHFFGPTEADDAG